MPLVTAEMNMTESLKKAGIIPDIVPENFVSSAMINVTYPDGKDVSLGNLLSTAETAKAPKVEFFVSEESRIIIYAFFIIYQVDPDAPTRENPTYSPYRHWVMVNTPSSSDFTKACELSSYIGPAPPPGTGLHRYIFLLYRQPKTNTAFDALSSNPPKWDFKSFAAEYNLELIGVNFFVSKNASDK
ncbi:phosphatidylethanolamine-binding protein [Pilobolus umbonatus]|nr:phosphatidylethanolamine-binding protein [Pilobolus umbonatus]